MSLSGPADLSRDRPPLVPAFLRPIRSLLLAVLEPDGSLVDANDGFHRLLSGSRQGDTAQAVRALFINPTFQELRGEL